MNDDYLAFEQDLKKDYEIQKQYLCTDADHIYGYMWYLIRNRMGFSQTVMGFSFSSLPDDKYKNGLSKSAYSKIENGETSINFDLILIYGSSYGINFNEIFALFSLLLDLAYKNECRFLKPCGHYCLGMHSQIIYIDGASKDSLYTKIKDYNNYFRQSDLNLINKAIDKIFERAKQAIEFSAASNDLM